MKRLYFILLILSGFMFFSCNNEYSELKKNMNKDINDLCKCNLDISKGKRIPECAKSQKKIKEKYVKHTDLLIELDDKVKDCVSENM